MKKIVKLLAVFTFILAVTCIFAISASAVPALIQEQTFTQPNGSTFKGTLKGDELFNYVQTTDGSILEQGEDGYWYYAEISNTSAEFASLRPSKAKYLIDAAPSARISQADLENSPHEMVNFSTSPEFADAEYNAPSAAVSYVGKQNLLVLLVDFKDRTAYYDAPRWAAQTFGTSGRTVANFYSSTTGGKISIVPAAETQGTKNDGVIRVKLNYNHPNTGRNIGSLNAQLTRDAIKAADPYINYAQYDKNGDGVLTSNELHIMVICAGFETSISSSRPSIWGHMWQGALYQYGNIADGKRFYSYTQFGEIQINMATIGIMCHELGHDFGLPDLYSIYDSSAGLGGYSVMSHGSWGSTGNLAPGAVPVGFDAYCKEKLGVVSPTIVTTAGPYDYYLAPNSVNSRDTLKITTANSKEYFLFENRQLTGYDAAIAPFLPSSDRRGGIAIYQINTNYEHNYSKSQMLVKIMEADQNYYGYSHLLNGDAYGGNALYATNRGSSFTVLSDTTSPSTLLALSSGYPWFTATVKSASSNSMLVNFGPASSWTSYNVTFNANGGSGEPPTLKKYKDFPAIIPTQTPTRSGFVFAGWATTPSAIIPNYPAGGTIPKGTNFSFTLYALWGRDIPITRYSGGTRIDTATAIATAGWPSGANTVVLASGWNFADALAGGPLAYALDAPILLTKGAALEPAVLSALDNLKPQNIVILGGGSSISVAIEDTLKKAYPSVIRYAGSGRIETAVAIAAALKESEELAGAGTSFDSAFIADGYNFPDALAVSSVAAIKGHPILFTNSKDPNVLHAATSNYITNNGIVNVVVIGGSSTVSNKVYTILQNEKGLASLERVSGSNRYSTAAAIYTKYSSIFSGTSLCITTGANFPDALAGSSYAAKIKAPLFLMDTGRYEATIRTLALTPSFSNIYVFGGSSSLPDSAIVQHLVI
ncbi:MAG: cell wall-binding repeat-containing protein [Oscillospiraceae bacterium]|nr:cell wall-binding repeat-containing protein [Oscillospiraceae bacterium]